MFDKDMLKSILAAYGPSGREQTVSDVIRSYVEPFADEVYNDTLGNLIAVKKGTSGKKVMLSAHMDQIGLIVVDIDEKGFLRVSNVGGVNPVVSVAREVKFENGTHGVTYFETEKHGAKDATMPELFVDIGATTREEAEAKVQIGDVAVYVTNFVEMGSRVSSGALDDRIACAAVVEAFRTMQNVHDVYAVFTVQDNGTGIVREKLPHLFDGIGFLPEKNGVGGRSQMGIGLSVCMSIVKAHGGSMSARNTDGGTVVSFSLPVPPVSETAAE